MKTTRRAATALAAVTTTLATAAAGVLAAAPASAAKAPEFWFGDIVVNSYELQEWESVVLAEVVKGKDAYPLPFQSYATAELYDCNGAKVRTDHGFSYSHKEPGKKWRTGIAVDLGIDRDQGPYSKWVVTVHSKGRAPVAKTITRSDDFILDCDGAFDASSAIHAPATGTRKPINADFSTSAEKLIAKHASFGKVVGAKKNKVKVGQKIGIKGAGRIVNGKRRTSLCHTALVGTHPTKKTWVAAIGGQCNQRYTVGKKMRFTTATGKSRTTSAIGKRLTLQSSVELRGHVYSRSFSLGKIRKG